MRTIVTILAAIAFASMAFTSKSASAAEVFTNTTPITIPTQGKASPYPSSIDVQGQSGRIKEVVVGLRGFRHTFPRDVDILLVSPTGETSVVMSDACGTLPVQNFTLVVGDSAPAAMPLGGSCDGVVYRPTNGVSDADSWPSAPPGPHPTRFGQFSGDDPNGVWSLYVVDDSPAASGKIEFGWSLTLVTAEPDAVVPGSGSGAANPYPLTRTVSGMSGVINDIDVTLRGVSHERPDDLDLLLVTPQGEAVQLMSDVCGETAVKGVSWTWDDEATAAMTRTEPCPGGRYKPSSYDPPEQWPAPAPGRPHGFFMSHIDYVDPNGEWRLYAYDDQPGQASGVFMERFELDIKTRPPARVGFTADTAEVTEGQSRELTVVRTSDGQGSGPATVTVTSSPLSATSGSDFKPVSTTIAFARGELRKTVSVEALADSLPEGAETFAVTIGQGSGDAAPAAPQTATVTIRNVARAPAAGATGAAGGSGPGGPTVDRAAPVIGGLSAKRSTLRYTLSEQAAVRLRLERARAGRRVGRACRAVTVRTRRGRPCRRFVAARTLRHRGRRGANKVAISRRALARGTYRVHATATDAAGNRSAPRTRRFRVAR